MTVAKKSTHRWTFVARFRARGFGWRSQPGCRTVAMRSIDPGHCF